MDAGDTRLLWIDLGEGRSRLGGSILAQAYGQLGDVSPDLESPGLLRSFATALRALRDQQRVLAYHDVSDGGLFVTLVEMAFAARCGLGVELPGAGRSARAPVRRRSRCSNTDQGHRPAGGDG